MRYPVDRIVMGTALSLLGGLAGCASEPSTSLIIDPHEHATLTPAAGARGMLELVNEGDQRVTIALVRNGHLSRVVFDLEPAGTGAADLQAVQRVVLENPGERNARIGFSAARSANGITVASGGDDASHVATAR